MQYEKKYWSSGEYTQSNGTPYVGYVGIQEGRGFIYETAEPLVKNDTYAAQINSSKYHFDRILDEELTLPHSKNEVLFQANDFLYSSTIRHILKKLQDNNDFLFKSAIISNTLVPNTTNCTILATEDNSKWVFVGASGAEYETYTTENHSDIDANQTVNPEASGDDVYALRDGEKARNKYPEQYKYIPTTRLSINLTNGVLRSYNLADRKNTRTALDPTFYPQTDANGNVSTPKFNFEEIVNAEMCVADVKEVNGFKEVQLFLFVIFKQKLMVIRHKFYPEAVELNVGSTIDFNNAGAEDGSVLVLETVDPANKNSLKFLSLRDVRVRDNALFLVDEKLNMVLRYDVTFLTSQDGDSSWNVKSIRLLDSLQGQGNVTNDTFFNKPVSVDADDDNIYIADGGNGCIKQYSASFDFIRTIKNGFFTHHDIQNITVSPYGFTTADGKEIPAGSLFIFSVTGNNMFVTVVSKGQVVYYHMIDKLELLKDSYTWDEEFKSVKFSFTNSNYFYLSTTKRVYKIHLSKPSYPFASLSYFKQRVLLSTMVWSRVPYPWHILPTGENDEAVNVTWSYRPNKTSAEVLDNRCFCIGGNDEVGKQFNGDIIFHIGTLYNQSAVDTYIKRHNCKFSEIPQEELAKMVNCSGIFLYNEPASYISSISDGKVPCYISEEIEDINHSEYINALTFNKLVYKVIYNLVNIKNTLLGRFVGAYNIDNLMVYDQLEYDDYFQSMRIENNDDFFIHDNEPNSIIVNRIFEKIYNLQETLLKHVESKYRSQGAFTNNSFRII